jgi:hypothetical protein
MATRVSADKVRIPLVCDHGIERMEHLHPVPPSGDQTGGSRFQLALAEVSTLDRFTATIGRLSDGGLHAGCAH